MSEIQCILERLSNDSDAEYDVLKALECLAQCLHCTGESSREEFLQNNGFAVVMQFYNISYIEPCTKVLHAWLASGTWPLWAFRRLITSSLSYESASDLRTASLKLLLDGVESSGPTKETLFSVDDSGVSLFEPMLQRLQTSPVSNMNLDELDYLLKLTKICASEGDHSARLKISCILLNAVEDTKVSEIQSQQLIQARFSQEKQVSYQDEENSLLQYTILLKTIKSVFIDHQFGEYLLTRSAHDSSEELVSRVVKQTRAIHTLSCSKVSRILDWNCKLKGFEERKFALKDSNGDSILALWLDFIPTLIINKQTAKWFYRSNLMSLMDSLCSYDDDNILSEVVLIYSQLAQFSVGACNEILEDKNSLGIAGLFHCTENRLCFKGIECLKSKVDMMSGNEFTWFETSPYGIKKLLEIFARDTHKESIEGFLSSTQTVLRALLERSRRVNGLTAPTVPQTGPWRSIQTQLLNSLDHPQANTTPSGASSSDKSLRKDLKKNKKQKEVSNKRDLYDEDGVRVVYDNGPSESVKANRSGWKALPLNEKVRWTQTSTEILTWIKVPKDTKAKHLAVLIKPERLTLRLDWYGRVIDGPLHRRCKATEAIWVLEDDEVHIMLPKDDEHYWKSLFQGGTEKSFMEILQESVESDEKVSSYDQLDERSKELIEEIQDRQQMVHDGLINLEGFDDFRIVVGENSL